MIDINIDSVKQNLNNLGYLGIDLDPTMDLFQEIEQLKKQKNAIILAHFYQDADIQDIADFTGDSLGLAQAAEKTYADIILFAGVHFMAETAKILNPNKKVLLPDLRAGCSLAESAPVELFNKFKNKHPNHIVISYINCTAEIKALTDVICTSSNAERIVNSFDKSQKIIFAPDKNLGNYLNKKLGRDMLLWNGSCSVHVNFSLEKIIRLKTRYPEALIIAHPECEVDILNIADFIGSTTELLYYTQISNSQSFIVVTESGILHKMKILSPNKVFIPGPPNQNCTCNDCPHMKLNTLEKIYICLKYELPEICLDADLIAKAYKPIRKMLDLSI
jgi:quinolinate synthase